MTDDIKINFGSRSINWVEPTKVPVQYDDPFDPIDPTQVMFNAQTSVIRTFSNGVVDNLSITIRHRGKSATYAVSCEIAEKYPMWFLDKCYKDMCNELVDDSGSQEERQTDYKVVGRLFSTMFEGYHPPVSLVHASPYSVETHMPEKTMNVFASPASRRLSIMSKKLPGVNEFVKHPISGNTYALFSIIANLNDEYRWTREQIADWIETLDININFE